MYRHATRLHSEQSKNSDGPRQGKGHTRSPKSEQRQGPESLPRENRMSQVDDTLPSRIRETTPFHKENFTWTDEEDKYFDALKILLSQE